VSYDRHPVRDFVDAGCAVVVGDDDPVTTGSRLGNELALLESAVGLEVADLARVRDSSVERVFCEESVRAALRGNA
jgi:adenosine deaminase